MEASATISVPGGRARIVTLQELKASEAWPRAFEGKYKDHRYYEMLEGTLANDFEFRYVVLEDELKVIRGAQPIFFVQQNLVEGVPGAIRSVVDLIRKAFPRFLTMRVLMVGCAAGEGQLGTCTPQDETWMTKALHAFLKIYAKQNKASLIVLKDFSATYRPVLETFASNGYVRVPSMPMTRLSLKHANFNDYLGTLGYITRKSLRRKFRKTERAAKIEMEIVTDIAPYVDAIFPLYLQVHERSPMKFENLTRDYFRSLSRLMPDRVRFFIWRQEGKLIAFSCCLVHEGKIYDECLGLDYSVALDLHLYFYTLRDVLTWGMQQGLDEYVSGPLNYDPKLHLGCALMPLDLYVRHTTPLLNPIFSRAVKLLEPTRHDPVLRKFPNAHEL